MGSSPSADSFAMASTVSTASQSVGCATDVGSGVGTGESLCGASEARGNRRGVGRTGGAAGQERDGDEGGEDSAVRNA